MANTNRYEVTRSHHDLVHYIYSHREVITARYGEWYSLPSAILYAYSTSLQSRPVNLDESVPYIKRILGKAGGGSLLCATGLFVAHPDKRGLFRLNEDNALAFLNGESLIQRGIEIVSDPRIEYERDVIEEKVDAEKVRDTPDQVFPYEHNEDEGWTNE